MIFMIILSGIVGGMYEMDWGYFNRGWKAAPTALLPMADVRCGWERLSTRLSSSQASRDFYRQYSHLLICH
jgi:hypothetical protein